MFELYVWGKKSSSWTTSYRPDCTIIRGPIDKDLVALMEFFKPSLVMEFT
jgi:hypothetical protein